MNCFTPSGVFEGQTVLVSFTPYTLHHKIRSELGDLKHAKSWIFFHLVKSLCPNEWENVWEPCNLALLANWHTLNALEDCQNSSLR